MDFGHRSSNETGNGGLLDNVDPHIREVVKVACQELPLPKLPVVPARANREHAIAMFGKKEVDEAVEPSDEYIRDPLTLGSVNRRQGDQQASAKLYPRHGRSRWGKSARIAIKA